MPMAALSWRILVLCVACCCAVVGASPAQPICRRFDSPSLHAVSATCPLQVDRVYPLEVSAGTLDDVLGDGMYSILFYASQCLFSRDFRPIFESLSSMFPHIKHFSVDGSTAMPVTLVMYGVHGFPTVLVGNRTSLVPYRGRKNLDSLVNFYRKTMGFVPVAYFDVRQPNDAVSLRIHRQNVQTFRERIANDPYLALSLLFIFLKLLFYHCPHWISLMRSLVARIVNALSHLLDRALLDRALLVVDAKRFFSKFQLSNKTGNLRIRASNARVWASSFTSVSLGERSLRL